MWLLLIHLCCVNGTLAAEVPAVAAAADLKFALTDIAARFEKESGRQIKLVFGSSGNFANQLAQRAPFELFLSADEGFVFRLADAGLTEDRGVLYSIGRIVLFVPRTSLLKADALLADLPAALADGRIRHFAIANPEHAPYGRAARAALRRMGAWPAIEPRLVLGENAAQAAQFALSGSTQGGIIPLSLAISPELSRQGSYAPIPAAWHADEPLRQRMVLMKGAGETAQAFYRYLQTPAVRMLFAGYGFVLPDEAAK
ncbi:MAG TPA: molybdate ABC transporter substrate-binding protein [Methyloversatilis sp.]